MGDVDKGFAEADFIGEGTYAYENVLNPLPLELPGVIAEWEGPGRLTVWSATQSASGHRFIVLSKMGFPDIRAISTHCGGSFGSNLDPLEFFGKNHAIKGEDRYHVLLGAKKCFTVYPSDTAIALSALQANIDRTKYLMYR